MKYCNLKVRYLTKLIVEGIYGIYDLILLFVTQIRAWIWQKRISRQILIYYHNILFNIISTHVTEFIGVMYPFNLNYENPKLYVILL